MKEMNVHYQNQGNYQLPYVTAKEQNELRRVGKPTQTVS